MADQAFEYLIQNRRVPSAFSTRLTNGTSVALSAGEAFCLMAKALADFRASGQFPAQVPVPTGKPAPPVPVSPTGNRGVVLPSQTSGVRTVATKDLLSQCSAVVGLVERFQALPSAVWVGTARLSCPEFFQAMAALLRVARHYQILPDLVSILPCEGPSTWQAPQPTVSKKSPSLPMQWEVKVRGSQPAPAPESQTKPPQGLSLLPLDRSEVKGTIAIVATFGQSPAYLVFSIDGKDKAITNCPPYSYQWDTASVPDGEHKISVRAVDTEGNLLDQKEITLMVSNTQPAEEAKEEGQ